MEAINGGWILRADDVRIYLCNRDQLNERRSSNRQEIVPE